MNNLNFWKDWRKKYRGIYQVLLFVFFISIIYSFYSQYNSYDLAFPKDTVRKTQSIELSLHNVQDFVFDLQIPARSYIVFQSFLSLDSGFQLSNTYLLIAVIFCCFSFLMTASTYLSRWWFIIFQSVFVIWIITLKLQFLNIFGIDNQLFTFVFVGLVLVAGYYFHAFKEDAGLFQRWLIFALILIALLSLVIIGSQVEAPVVFMAHHGIIIPVILAIIFIFNVAYDIILHILYLLAAKKSPDGSSNLMHFLIISLLYLIYVGLTFAKNDNLINIEIIYLNEFVLFGVSAVLGIWGFRKRSELIEKQLIFRPLGGYVYLAMGIMAFSVLTWVFRNGNDPLMDTFEDMIIFSHLGFGVLFFFYVLYNFVALLKAGHGIYPVVFRPVNIPYNLVRAVGFGIVVVLVLRVSYLPYYQAISGYYVSLADYYQYIGEEEKATTTYKIARQYAVTSHKHNFEIGKREYEAKNWAEASTYFSQANFKRPSVQAYLNKVQSQLNANLVFEALFTLEDAQKDFPDNPFVLNIKGLVYEKLNKTDSSFIYFDAAERAAKRGVAAEVAKVNRLALFAKKGIDEELPHQSSLSEGSVAYQANYLALANRKREFIDSIKLEASKVPEILTYNDFSFIFNYSMNRSLDNRAFKSDTVRWLARFSENESFSKSLKYATAYRLNYSGKIKDAYSYIYELENENISDAGFYYLLHGMWLMEQKAYAEAAEHFAEAADLKMSKANTYRTIALILDERLFEAAQVYDKQLESESISPELLQNDPLYQFLQAKPAQLPDSFKYLWLKTNSSLQAGERDSMENELKKSPFLSLLKLNNVENLIKKGEEQEAKALLLNINLSDKEKGLMIYRNNLLALLATISRDEELAKQVDEANLLKYPYNYQLVWEAFQHRDNLDKLGRIMERLGNENPYFESAILLSANYFNEQGNQDKAYEILVESSRLNTGSTDLLKAYALQAISMNLSSYAEKAYNDLAKQLTLEEWEEFAQKYETIKEEVEQTPW
ncbi:tetratricopeptide repeat protein [Marivirga sp.]|uniref:tetratricopeptide repeat protein n=1 Tax=Marivirga sp. TaxID=2018662 RepID=UPI003DA6F0B3